jgi:hypothetical protein
LGADWLVRNIDRKRAILGKPYKRSHCIGDPD